ncbi:MAG: acyltransferase family protein [Cyanobacteria bacterium J06623_4]
MQSAFLPKSKTDSDSTLKLPSRFPKGSNIDFSLTLRGIVIVAVLLNHYVDDFMTLEGHDIANTMVSVFFVLSGYGISASLHKKLGEHLSVGALLGFYRIRIAKVFPLLWVALLLESLVTNHVFSIADFLGYKLTEHYWFISSLLECYLLSPLLYLLLNYKKNITLALMTLLFLVSNHAIGQNPELKSALMNFHLTGFPYMELYLSNICLFFGGMYFHQIGRVRQPSNSQNQQQLASHTDAQTGQRSTGYQSILFILLLLSALGYIFLERFFYSGLPFIGGPVLLSVLSFYALSMRCTPNFWLRSGFIYAGRHSLALYLLHMPYFYFLERINIISIDSLTSIAMSIALLPLFFGIALVIEKLSNTLSNRLIGARL